MVFLKLKVDRALLFSVLHSQAGRARRVKRANFTKLPDMSVADQVADMIWEEPLPDIKLKPLFSLFSEAVNK